MEGKPSCRSEKHAMSIGRLQVYTLSVTAIERAVFLLRGMFL